MKKAVGIDLGGTYIKFGLVDESGQILKKGQIPTLGERKSRDIVLSQMHKAVETVIENGIAGIGIGTPGVVDNDGVVFESPNLPDWHNLPLKAIFADRWNVPIVVENDVNSITWGEYLFGAGKGCRTIICLTLGTGVGGGMVINGALLRGANYSAAEIGHITVDYKGRKCGCGSIGCVEAYVGRDYIIREVVRKINDGRKTVITDLVNNDLSKITPKIISEAWEKGDALAEETWIEVGTALGAHLAGLVNLVNPDRIILGGGIAQAGEILFATVRKIISERSMKVLSRNVTVVSAGLGTDAGIVSGAALILRK
jgi:glucokinase